jgi:hypothetical protein
VRAVGHPFDGFVYRAQFDLGASRKIVSINIHSSISKAHLSIERVVFVDASGNAVSLATLTNKNEFRLAFMSDTTAIWENLTALPRAFLVHRAEVVSHAAAFERLHQPDFREDETVLLESGQAITAPGAVDATRERVTISQYKPERVSVTVHAEQPGYLVLSDSWYPGWNASVDSASAAIERADYAFRAVRVEPGDHAIVFEFRPTIVYIGVAVSVVSLAILIALALVMRRAARKASR